LVKGLNSHIGLVFVWITKIVSLLLISCYVLESFSYTNADGLSLNPTLITG